jgi:hypothetical protein
MDRFSETIHRGIITPIYDVVQEVLRQESDDFTPEFRNEDRFCKYRSLYNDTLGPYRVSNGTEALSLRESFGSGSET